MAYSAHLQHLHSVHLQVSHLQHLQLSHLQAAAATGVAASKPVMPQNMSVMR
jgi:hypothetical protein